MLARAGMEDILHVVSQMVALCRPTSIYLDNALEDHDECHSAFPKRVQNNLSKPSVKPPLCPRFKTYSEGRKECPDNGNNNPGLEGSNIVDGRSKEQGKRDEDDHNNRLNHARSVKAHSRNGMDATHQYDRGPCRKPESLVQSHRVKILLVSDSRANGVLVNCGDSLLRFLLVLGVGIGRCFALGGSIHDILQSVIR